MGSDCIRSIDPKANAVNDYFKYILEKDVQGIYKGQDENGLQRFAVRSNTKLVQQLPTVKHLNPPVIKNLKGKSQVSVMYPKAACLIEGQVYSLKLKAKYKRGQLTFTAL